MLRALGIEIVPAKPEIPPAKPHAIYRKIEEDNDFDLIISDIQWLDADDESTYGGMELVKELREKQDDPVIRALPVIFYTAYEPYDVETIVKDVGIERFLKIEFCYSIEELVQKAIMTIAESRSSPIKVGRKRPT